RKPPGLRSGKRFRQCRRRGSRAASRRVRVSPCVAGCSTRAPVFRVDDSCDLLRQSLRVSIKTRKSTSYESMLNQLIKSLPAVLRASGNAEEVAQAAAISAWKHAAGDGLKNHAVPLRLEDRTLIVAVADRIWQRQLHAMRG